MSALELLAHAPSGDAMIVRDVAGDIWLVRAAGTDRVVEGDVARAIAALDSSIRPSPFPVTTARWR